MQVFQTGKNKNKINKYSIGVEIQNPGHSNGYIPYNEKQISAIKFLSKKLAKKFNICKKKTFRALRYLAKP